MIKYTTASAVLTIAVALMFTTICAAVPPAHESQFGNPEEPALRVVKWPWLGVRKLTVSAHEGLRAGIEKSPTAAVCQGARGAACGAVTLVDHTARGLVYAPLPPKAPLRQSATYEERALAFLETVEAASAAQTKTDDAQSAETDDAVDDLCDDATRDEFGSLYMDRKAEETDVVRAQRRYVPVRASYRDRTFHGGGNLLRLAR